MMTNRVLLEKAIEIIKEYAKNSAGAPVDTMLERVYEMLKKLNTDLGEE